MSQFSISNQETLNKIRAIFCNNSQDAETLNFKQTIKFITELGLNNDIFMRDLSYYFPKIQKGESVTYQEILHFLEYILGNKNTEHENIEAAKCFDKNGTGQINTAQLLTILKKRLNGKDYQLYSHLISSSYGPFINYLELLKKIKKNK